MDYLVDHVFWSNWTLMREIKAEIDGGFSDLLFHISAFSKDFSNQMHYFDSYCLRLNIPEECGEGFLEKLKYRDVIFEDRILQTFKHEFKENVESEFHWHVLNVDFC